MTVSRTNHSAAQTDWAAACSKQVDIAVLPTEPKETLGEIKMAPEWSVAPEWQTAEPGANAGQTSNSSLEIVVLHTSPTQTLSALKMAAELASGLAPVRLLVVQVVPYPAPNGCRQRH